MRMNLILLASVVLAGCSVGVDGSGEMDEESAVETTEQALTFELSKDLYFLTIASADGTHRVAWVRNSGAGTAPSSWMRVRSNCQWGDQSVECDDDYVFVPSIGPNQTRFLNVPCNPKSLNVYTLDIDDVVSESNENNNWMSRAGCGGN